MLTAPQIPTKEELYKVGYKVYKKYRPYGKNSTKKWFMEVEKELWASAALAYITEWEKIRNSTKQGKIYSRNTGVDYNAFYAEIIVRHNCSSKRYALAVGEDQ